MSADTPPSPVTSSARNQPGASSAASVTTRPGNPLRDLLLFAPLWGVVAYVCFYAVLPTLPFQRDLLLRYCTSHPLEYVTMALFFLGMSALIVRRIELGSEQQGLERGAKLLQEIAASGIRGGAERASRMQRQLASWNEGLRFTWSGRRLQEAVQYQAEFPDADKLDEHLRHLADLEHDKASQRFGFINTISWAVPILGFLGTVMGITLAIANVTPDQLDKSLPEVTGGLAVAFDTTALSLSLSLVLVFGTYLVRKKQDTILTSLEQELDHRLCFLLRKPGGSGLAGLHGQMSDELVQASALIVSEATALWRENLQRLETSFSQSLEQEKLRVAELLQQGTEQTIAEHQELFARLRDHELRQQQHLASQFDAALLRWENSLGIVTQQLQGQAGNLQTHTELLVQLVDKRQELVQMEQQFHDAMDAHQIATTLDQTLNSLTAAIQLLSERTPAASRAA